MNDIEVKQNNLTNFMVLPMLRLNKSSFGVENFINSFLDVEGYIVVNTKIEPQVDFTEHECYATDFEAENGTLMIVFIVPEQFKADIKTFVDGKFSNLSDPLKDLITRYCGLKTTSTIVRCLNPSKGDRQAKADELGVKVDLILELRSAPNEGNFIKVK